MLEDGPKNSILEMMFMVVGVASVRHQSRLANSGRPYAVALHSFLGTEAGDLTFNKGELIELLGDVNESAWIKGQLGSVTGIFPSKWVRGDHTGWSSGDHI